MRYYLYDKFGAYTGNFTDVPDPYAPLPPMSTMQEPPTVADDGKVAIFSGDVWFVGDAPVVTPAMPEVPQSITMRQARLQLHKIGKLADVQAAINALPEPPKTEAQIEWDYASVVERASSFVVLLTPALGLSEEEMDNLFREAVQL